MSENMFSQLIDNFIDMAERQQVTTGLWREQPVDLLTFLTSKDFLGETPYPGKQTEILEVVNKVIWWKLTEEEQLCPANLREVTELVFMLGKGSGKDFLASSIMAYVCYMLCCMADPHKYFGFGKDEPIDLVNVAINAYQANNVFFKKLKARLMNCRWFKSVNRFPTSYNEFQLTKNQIRFYRNITAHSAHSEAESLEGFNPLVVIFDEIGGYDLKVAEDIYTMFRSSAISRFGDKSLLIFISYPRSQEDFMYKKYKESIENNDPQVYAIKGKTWEVNLATKKEDFKKEYEIDPEGAKTRLECEPPAYRDTLFQYPEYIDRAIAVGKKAQNNSLVVQQKITTKTLDSGIERYFIGLELYNLILDPQYTYYLGGDGGVNTDSYVISLFHAEPTLIKTYEEGQEVEKWINKPIEDLILEWRPSKKDRLPVDLINVSEILEKICKQVYVKKALFDKFNSAEVVQRLISLGVEAEDKNFSNQFQVMIYTNLKSLIYSDNIVLLDHTVDDGSGRLNANEELKAIKIINGNKIDHDPDKSKDYSDARAAAVWLCTSDPVDAAKNFSMPVLFGTKRKS